MRALAGFAIPFEVIEVPPLSADHVANLVRAEAGRLSLEMDAPAATRLLELCSHFMPAAAGPGPALRLVGQIRDYLNEKRAVGEDEPVTAGFVEKVFAVYSGLPRFVVSRQDVRPVAELLMERRVEDASILRLTARHGEVKVAVLESEYNKEQRREAEPLRLADGQKVGREALQAMLVTANAQLEAITAGIDLPAIQAERETLENRRREPDLWRDPPAAAHLLEACDRMDRVLERIARLKGDQAEITTALSRATKRDELSRLAERVRHHAGYAEHARRELLLIGPGGFADALLEIRPIGRARATRDLLYKTYATWAEERKYRVLMIREPMTDDEPVMIAVVGPYAYGYLRGEAGHHRLRTDRDTFVARVGVAALDSAAQSVTISVQRALKQVGQYGGRVRSRVEVSGSGFVVQNASSLAENRELAEELAPSWLNAASESSTIVRRYDLEPFLVRDFVTGITTGRADILHAEPFHELLCNRIDAGRSGHDESMSPSAEG